MLDIQQRTYQLRSSKVSSSFLGVVLSMAGLHGEESIEFNRDIRPLLSDNCYLCHGPDAEERKADLALLVAMSARVSVAMRPVSGWQALVRTSHGRTGRKGFQPLRLARES